MPVKNLYSVEALKFVFKSRNELYSKYQPAAINELFKPQTDMRHTRRAENFLIMRLPRNCKKGNALYNLSMKWNTAKDDHKLAGNLFALKQSLKEEIMKSIIECTMSECLISKKDARKDYQRYQEG